MHTVYTASVIAAGLVAPGPGVALLVWFFTLDGRIPGRDVPVWRVLFSKANLALAHGIPSLAFSHLNLGPEAVTLPVQTVLYALTMLVINYSLTARVVAFLNGTSVTSELAANTTWATVQSLILLGIAGGSLSVLIRQNVGYVMGVGLLGFLVLVRANMSQQQALYQAQFQTLQLAAQALDVRDAYTESHSERVAELAVRIGQQLGLGRRMLASLRTAGSLHDLGKIGVRDHILNKAGPLTPDEWEVMKSHAAIGAEMISKHSQLAHVASMVRGHHERFDGSGYPDGLAGHAIPLGARILAVADSFDTMTGPRVYRQSSMSPAEAITELSSLAGRSYDPEVVAALQALYAPHSAPSPSSVNPLAFIRRYPSFARFAVGSGVSAAGDPMTTVATLVFLYAGTRQPLLVAAAYAAKSAASLLTTAVAGTFSDRYPRRRLVFSLELFRALLLFGLPFALVFGPVVVLVASFLLGAAGALVQPARQAALPNLVAAEDLPAANGLLSAVTTGAALVAFPLAGAIYSVSRDVGILFVLDGLTFLAAALSIVGLAGMGGGVRTKTPIGTAYRTAWGIRPARRLLVIATLVSALIGMTFPLPIAIAFSLSRTGPQAYTYLEAALTAGIVLGSLIMSRRLSGTGAQVMLTGLILMGVFSVGVSFSPTLLAAAACMLVASVGNPMYAVSNQTGLLAVGNSQNRGSLMATRLALTQPSALIGTALGGLVTAFLGGQGGYAIVGAGLLLVALTIAASAWRREAERDSLQASGRDGAVPVQLGPSTPQPEVKEPEIVGV